MEEKDRFAFLADWYDPTAALLRRYQLFYYPHDSSVEMFDVKNQRIFLRRTKYGDLRPGDLFVGGRVNVFSRQLNIVDYGDKYTAAKLGSKKERTLALLKPDGVNKVGDVLEMANQANLMVTNAKMTHLTWSQAADFYVEHQSKPFFNSLVQQVCSGPVVALELVGDEAVSVWRNLLGHSDAAAAHKEAPQSAGGQLGSDLAHGSDSLSAAARELEFFFPTTICHGPVNTALYSQCTCCIIKPHAVSQVQRGPSQRRGVLRSLQRRRDGIHGHGDGAVFGTQHGSGAPRRRRSQDLPRLLRARRSGHRSPPPSVHAASHLRQRQSQERRPLHRPRRGRHPGGAVLLQDLGRMSE
ncbi:nucleoside diphosphate kinase 7 isoform X4 [Phycodurus eques]|uniref:nucleoside diphosphate kinase 7 isoform X4 n=1 Tax=Phycodurus eques TaxID=693459 RepID=UPI002ACED4F5|nr:nucleoside diphosphate kinase 7 isoform X4 [Phycodurus eques]